MRARPALFQAVGAFPGISAHLLVDGILEPNKLNHLHNSRDGHSLRHPLILSQVVITAHVRIEFRILDDAPICRTA